MTIYSQNSSASIKLLGTRLAKVPNPKAALPGFSTPSGLAGADTSSVPDAKEAKVGLNTTNDVIFMQTKTSRAPYEGGTNSFTVTLVPRTDYFRQVSPGDWVELTISNGSTSSRCMVGSVDTVHQSRRVASNGAEEWVVTLSGRDWSKAIPSTECVFDTQLGSLVEQAYLMQFAGEWMHANNSALLGPGEFVKELLALYLGGKGKDGTQYSIKQFQLPDGASIGQRLKFDLASNLVGKAPVMIINQTQSLSQMLRIVANPLLNELWFETDPKEPLTGRPFRVVLREYPFSASSFNALPSHSVRGDECTSVSLAKTVSDVRNWFRAFTDLVNGSDADVTAVQRLGTMVPSSIRKFGLRRLEQRTPFIFDSDPANPVPTLVDAHTRRLTEWNWQNEKLVQGVLAMRLRPDIRVGNRIDYSDSYNGESFKFYVDSVEHTFTYPGTSSTVVRVSRGVGQGVQLLSYDALLGNGLVKLLGQAPFVESAGAAAAAAAPTTTP